MLHLITEEFDLLTRLKEIQGKEFVRDDYKEFIDLAILLLERRSEISHNFVFLTCGALHKARWMAKVVYAMKMVLYKYELEAQQINIFEDGQYEKLAKFVMFM